jgi:hypothetical protein
VREKSEEFGRLAGVGYEEDGIVLILVSTPSCAAWDEKISHTFRISPRSPCSASAACMKLHAMPRLFIVATIFRPTSPLLPTPHIMSLPPLSVTLAMVSTPRSNPSCASESDSYRRVTCDRAAAAVERTFTARETRRVPSESEAVRGGVRGSESISTRLRLWQVDVGGEACSEAAIMLKLTVKVQEIRGQNNAKAQGMGRQHYKLRELVTIGKRRRRYSN